LLGKVVAGYKLVTTVDLAAETAGTSGLGARQAWLAAPEIQAELAAATLKFREPKKSKLEAEAAAFRAVGNAVIRRHCESQGIVLRSLSAVDSRAWAAAAVLGGVLATDEWPMRLAASKAEVDDDGNTLSIFTTIELVHLLEKSGELTRAQRIDVIRSWKISGEAIHRDTDATYRRLFNEEPPNAQADIDHKA
jgi:hypothetical protein